MSPFWKSFFDEFKDHGRDATPFLLTIPILIGLTIIISIFEKSGLANDLPVILFWAAVIATPWVFVAFRRHRKRRRERWERKELSSDELRVARSKLMKDRGSKSA